MPNKTRKLPTSVAIRPTIPKELIDLFVSDPMTGEAVNHPPGGAQPAGTANHCNGSTGKTVLTDGGVLRLEMPRDRDASFEPVLIAKHQRRFTGFDDKIIGFCARGVSLREIQAFLLEAYGTEVVCLALDVQADGRRDILGIWIENTEGAKFWMKVFNESLMRGAGDILIAVTDGLKGLSEALAVAFPADPHRGHGRGRRLGPEFPTVAAAWRRAWDRVIPVFAFPPEVRRVIYNDQCDRKRQCTGSQNHRRPQAFSQRRRGCQTDLARVAQHHGIAGRITGSRR